MNNNTIGEPLLRYARVNTLILATYGLTCLDVSYKDMVNSLRQTSWQSSASEGGSWKEDFNGKFYLEYKIMCPRMLTHDCLT